MSLRFAIARAIGSVATWGLKSVFRRPAANFPGKAALLIDPLLLSHVKPRLSRGSICVVGTNGKTTCANMIADTLERAGLSVVCNRTGANLDSGVASALLQSGSADWGVFECDELWLSKILPGLKSDYVVLLNLFRDQLDRVGEIERTQESIASALRSSPDTVLVYNADDPFCEAVARRAGNKRLAFGIEGKMDAPSAADESACICQECATLLRYDFRQYGQLGSYSCSNCGFARAPLDFAVRFAQVGAEGLSFALSDRRACNSGSSSDCTVRAPYNGAYMVYNLAAVLVASSLAGASMGAALEVASAFDPKNGRLERYELAGCKVLTNLAKNPTGFNQNLALVAQAAGPVAAAFFVNDKEGDGRDVSWLWDVAFEELGSAKELAVYAGGIRRNDLQVRLKYAGIDATLVDGAEDALARAARTLPGAQVFMVANYTALPIVKAELDCLAQQTDGESARAAAPSVQAASGDGPVARSSKPGAPMASAASEAAKAAGSAGGAVPKSAAQARRAASADVAGNAGAHAGEGAEKPDARCLEHADEVALHPIVAAAREAETAAFSDTPLVIVHLFPDLLNLYGDDGNVSVLAQRARQRRIPVEVVRVRHGDSCDLSRADIVFLGGGPNREQRVACEELQSMRADLASYVSEDGVLLAICGGFQIIGDAWFAGEERVEGLKLIDVHTFAAPEDGPSRIIGDIALKSLFSDRPVIGFENHAGRTALGPKVAPFGQVIGGNGQGNNDEDNVDGALFRNVVGTYLHGTLLAKNPQVADALIERALARRAKREERPVFNLAPLDDAVENAANDYMAARLGVNAR